MSLSIYEPISRELQLQRFGCTQLPGKSKLVEIARLYAEAFAGPPWNESKVCKNGHFSGPQQPELTSCTNCGELLGEAYPEKETVDYINKELTNQEGTLITCENENGEVAAAGWGFACTIEELQGKYTSSAMKGKVVEVVSIFVNSAQPADDAPVKETAEKVQRVFYLSEIMVHSGVRKQGIATAITQYLGATARSLKLILMMRTRNDSPMVRIAENMQMSQVIGLGEDGDNPNRVLYMKM